MTVEPVHAPAPIQRFLEPARDGAGLAAMFLWQLDDLSRRLTRDTRGAGAEELAWQPAPGQNTIGLLLGHIAVTEVLWIDLAVRGRSIDDPSVLPIAWRHHGVPLPPGAPPPAWAAGKELAEFDALLAAARAHTRHALEGLDDGDLARRFRIDAFWEPGTPFEATVAWALYHLIEHLAGHYGQINLLRHQYRLRGSP